MTTTTGTHRAAPATPPATPPAPTSGPSPTNEPGPPWRALPVLLAGTFLVILDFFGVNVSLPSLTADLHASDSEVLWVVAGYGLTLAATLLLAGRIGDHSGRRRAFSIGIGIFTAASLACAVAPNAATLVAARLVQGVGAAFIVTGTLSLIGVLFSGPAQTKAIAAYGLVMGVVAAGGQLVGGALIAGDLLGLGWRAIFAVNVPVGIAALVLAPLLVPESRAEQRGRFDVTGTLLAAGTMVALVVPLVQGRGAGWPLWTWLTLAAVPVLAWMTARYERRVERSGGFPIFPPSLLRRRSLATGLLAQGIFWCGQASFYFVLALYLQEGVGLDALHAGLAFAILAGGYLVTSFAAPALAARHGRFVPVLGLVTILAGYGALWSALHQAPPGAAATVASLVPGLLLVGAGQGLCITPLTAVILAHSSPEHAGAVSGALQTAQQAGNSVGVAVVGIVFYAGDSIASSFGSSLVLLAGIAVLALGAVGLTSESRGARRRTGA